MIRPDEFCNRIRIRSLCNQFKSEPLNDYEKVNILKINEFFLVKLCEEHFKIKIQGKINTHF